MRKPSISQVPQECSLLAGNTGMAVDMRYKFDICSRTFCKAYSHILSQTAATDGWRCVRLGSVYLPRPAAEVQRQGLVGKL